MTKYYVINSNFFEEPKTTIAFEEKKNLKDSIAGFNKSLIDPRYKDSKAKIIVIGHVKKQR